MLFRNTGKFALSRFRALLFCISMVWHRAFEKGMKMKGEVLGVSTEGWRTFAGR